MKKIICAVFCLLFLCSCSEKAGDVSVVNKGISFTAHIDYYEDEYECNVKIDGNGAASFLVTKPENLKDFTVIFNGENVRACYRGLSFEPDLNVMKQGSCLKSFYKMISYFDNENYEVLKTKDSFYVNGTAEGEEFKLILTQAGLPLSASFKDKKLNILFSNISYL